MGISVRRVAGVIIIISMAMLALAGCSKESKSMECILMGAEALDMPEVL